MQCVVCGSSVPSVLARYGVSGEWLARCEACGNIADHYVTCDAIGITLDLLLHRQPAYRHMLSNCRHNPWHLVLSGAAIVLCDASQRHDLHVALYGSEANSSLSTDFCRLAWSVLSAIVEFAVYAFTAAAVAAATEVKRGRHATHDQWRRTAAALLLASVGKPGLILAQIWSFPLVFGAVIEGFTLLGAHAAVQCALKCNAVRAAKIVVASGAARAIAAAFLLRNSTRCS